MSGLADATDDLLQRQPPSAEAQLLLLCARGVLDSEGEDVLIRLLAQQLDWDAVLQAAEVHYIEPLIVRHLLGRGDDLVPIDVKEQLRARQRQGAMQALQIVSVQQQLVERVFGPRRVSHAFFKGASLAERYYGDPAQRRYRDVDVLVDARRIAEVGEVLAELGYSVTNAAWETYRQRDLKSFCRYNSALEMRSPQGVLVELHKTLDSTGCIFSSRRLLAGGYTPAEGRYRWRTLAPTDMFVYLCYHHARHRWSSLHWCADLDVVTRHPDFDANAVHSRSADMALSATLQDALRLKDDLRLLALGRSTPADRPASRFLQDCMAAVDASLQSQQEYGDRAALATNLPTAAEQEQRPDQRVVQGADREPDFQYAWQFSSRYRRRFLLSRWRPSANDVNARPLPLSLHWLYYLSRPLRIALARLREAAARARSRIERSAER